MIRSKVLQLAVATALIAGAQNVLACSTAAWTGAATTATSGEPPTPGFARYSGRCSLRSSAATQFVVDSSPNGSETTFKARWYTFTGDLVGEADIFQAQNTAAANIIRVTYDGAQFKFYVNGTANTATVPALPNRYYGIEVRWAAAGTFTALVKGAAALTPTTVTISGFTGGTIDTARLGWISGGSLGVGGRAPNFDEYDSRRTSDIGFLCRGDSNNNGSITGGDAQAVINEVTNGTLTIGQPDANENGGVTGGDAQAIVGLVTSGVTCS